MANEGRKFPPSEIKLAELRRHGVVPFSLDVTTAAVFLGFIIGIFVFLAHGLSSALIFFEDSFFGVLVTSGQETHQQLRLVGESLWSAIFTIIFPILVCVFIVGGIQTKFLFSIKPLAFDFGKPFRVVENLDLLSARRILDSAGKVLKIICWLGVAALLGVYLFAALFESGGIIDFREVFGSNSGKWNIALREQAVTLLPLFGAFAASIIGFSIFIAIPARFLVFMRFIQQHQMTRNEIEAELREYEVAPEIIQARQERYEIDSQQVDKD